MPPPPRPHRNSPHTRRASRTLAIVATLLGSLAALLYALPTSAAAAALPQQDPELRGVVEKAIGEAQCFVDKYDSAVWFTLMEPKLLRYVKNSDESLQVLQTVYGEA